VKQEFNELEQTIVEFLAGKQLSDPTVPTSITDGFQKEVALFVAETTRNFKLAVKEGIEPIPIPSGCELVTWITTSDSPDKCPKIGTVLYSPTSNTCWILFRGTITTDEWMADLLYKQLPASAIKLPSYAFKFDLQIHSGFLTTFDSVKPQISPAVSKAIELGATNIVVSGHSLGGAVASLTAVYVYAFVTQSLPIRTYTFGKPRFGNIDYAKSLNEKFPNRFYRVENYSDLVPSIPFASTPNLQQLRKPFEFQHEGLAVAFNTKLSSLILRHSLECYITFLKSLK